jgi:hypothetical protein
MEFKSGKQQADGRLLEANGIQKCGGLHSDSFNITQIQDFGGKSQLGFVFSRSIFRYSA